MTIAHTRQGMAGNLDKLAIIDAMATKAATQDAEFCKLVHKAITHASSRADHQVREWCKFVESRPYRREAGERFVEPKHTYHHGGDCDDLVILLVAGCRSLGIPAKPEVFARDDGHGYHIRARIGLPAHAPKVWLVADPVWKSEGEWLMRKTPPAKWELGGTRSLQGGSFDGASSKSAIGDRWWLLPAALIALYMLR